MIDFRKVIATRYQNQMFLVIHSLDLTEYKFIEPDSDPEPTEGVELLDDAWVIYG